MRLKTLFILLVCFYNTQAQMSDTSLLIGTIEHKDIKGYSWYGKTFSEYTPDQTSVDGLKPFVNDLKVMAVMGTWCSDSHELLPAFYKISEQAGISDNQIELIAVDRKKHCPMPDITSLNIEYVPTFFVFYKGKLVGKIVETPNKTLEADMLELLTKSLK
jgi:thiol-disulfide isomerase/thioredoxin